MLQCFSQHQQKSLDIFVYQGFICFEKYPEPNFFPNHLWGM